MRPTVHDVDQLDEDFGGELLQWVACVPWVQQREDESRGAGGDDLEGIGLEKKRREDHTFIYCMCMYVRTYVCTYIEAEEGQGDTLRVEGWWGLTYM